MVTTVTGCGGLHTRTDCSCNVYAYGCHLLCHDDVIANRRVRWGRAVGGRESGWRRRLAVVGGGWWRRLVLGRRTGG